jgi:hypothetical protein
MDEICREVELGHLINEHGGLGNEHVPGILADAIAVLQQRTIANLNGLWMCVCFWPPVTDGLL